jgi:hypothetical protein
VPQTTQLPIAEPGVSTSWCTQVTQDPVKMQVKRMEVCYIYAYEDSVMKSIKHLEKQEYNGGGELFPNTLYACLELSQ